MSTRSTRRQPGGTHSAPATQFACRVVTCDDWRFSATPPELTSRRRQRHHQVTEPFDQTNPLTIRVEFGRETERQHPVGIQAPRLLVLRINCEPDFAVCGGADSRLLPEGASSAWPGEAPLLSAP